MFGLASKSRSMLAITSPPSSSPLPCHCNGHPCHMQCRLCYGTIRSPSSRLVCLGTTRIRRFSNSSTPIRHSREVIESVLTNYHELFRKARVLLVLISISRSSYDYSWHPELLLLLQHHLSPLPFKNTQFSLTLRGTFIVFLLLILRDGSRSLSRRPIRSLSARDA